MCGRVFFFSLFFFFFTSVQSLFLFGSSSFATTIPFFPIFFSVIILLTCNELAEPLNIFIFVPKKLCFSSVMLTFFTFSLLSFFPFPFIFHLSFFTTYLFSFLFFLLFIYLGEGQKKRKPNMQWGDFLIVAVISGEFIFLVPGPRVFLNHYGMWFPATDERLLRRNTPVCSKIKKNTSYLFLLSLLGDCGRGQFVPRGRARGNFQVSVFQSPSCRHTKSCVHPQPTCQRWT